MHAKIELVLHLLSYGIEVTALLVVALINASSLLLVSLDEFNDMMIWLPLQKTH